VERIICERPEFDRIGLRLWIPELLRTLSEAMPTADPASVDAARAILAEAAEMAAIQSAPMLSLRIATEARCDRSHGAFNRPPADWTRR
jgi:hypothetical protein